MSIEEQLDVAEELIRTAAEWAASHQAINRSSSGSVPSRKISNLLDANLETAMEIARSLLGMAKTIQEAEPQLPREDLAIRIIALAQLAVRIVVISNAVIDELRGTAPDGGTPPAGPAPPATHRAGGGSCSFCGKSDHDAKLVAGPKVFICGSCALLACRMLGIAPPNSGP